MNERTQENLWFRVGNQCLSKAATLLDEETVPTAATAETVRELVETAISIDKLNLLWEVQSQSDTRASLDQIFL